MRWSRSWSTKIPPIALRRYKVISFYSVHQNWNISFGCTVYIHMLFSKLVEQYFKNCKHLLEIPCLWKRFKNIYTSNVLTIHQLYYNRRDKHHLRKQIILYITWKGLSIFFLSIFTYFSYPLCYVMLCYVWIK